MKPMASLRDLTLVIWLAAGPLEGQVPGDSAQAAARLHPSVVRFGAPVSELQPPLTTACRTLKLRDINPPFRVLRDIVTIKQIQIDCDGFEYFGKPRWTEFVVADDALQMVWILTDSTDERGLLAAMTRAYGAPTHRNEKFIAFANARVALRTDRPEVLLYSELLAPRVLPWFGIPSTFR